MIKRWLLRKWYRLIGKGPGDMDMVQYWKSKDCCAAIITTKDGSTTMILDGEKYPMWGFPRGHILFGALSPLKHQIKNQIFNDSWWKLEKGTDRKEVVKDIKKSLESIYQYAEPLKYDLMPPEKMCPAVREIHRAWTKVAPEASRLRDMLTLILQEDDGYRYRVQFLAGWFPLFKWFPIKALEKGLQMVEHAEVIGDMKERIRLLRRILLLILEDKKINKLFKAFFKEVNWNKVKLSRADKFHFRGKYFKVDYDVLEY